MYSYSSNELDGSSSNSIAAHGRNLSDPTYTGLPNDTLGTRHQKGIIDTIPDFALEYNDVLLDDDQQQFDRKSQVSESVYDDRKSVKSSDKVRKSLLSSKLLKSFHNFRSNKKANIA